MQSAWILLHCGRTVLTLRTLTMFERRSLRLPITVGVIMIFLIVVMLVGWILVNTFALIEKPDAAPVYITLLSVGVVFLVMVLVGVVIYLTLSVKAISLNRRQSNFIDSVTHELKSPIASLKLYLQTLNRRQVSQEERDEFHRFMLEDIERLDHLINHLLEAGRLDRDPIDAEYENVRIDDLIQLCSQAVCLRYRLDPSTVHLDLEPAAVYAKRVDVDMILSNLIDNAVKYAGDEPQVDIILRCPNEKQVSVRILDNGRGIPVDQRRRIFGRFERLGLELERDKTGTGLGLYIVRTLVRRLRGKIRVRGRDNTPGTEFEVLLRSVPLSPTDNPETGDASPDPSAEVA